MKLILGNIKHLVEAAEEGLELHENSAATLLYGYTFLLVNEYYFKHKKKYHQTATIKTRNLRQLLRQ